MRRARVRSKRSKKTLLQSAKEAGVVMSASCMKQHSAYSDTRESVSSRSSLLLLSILTGGVVLLLSCLIKTESVVQQKPRVISSYADVLAREDVQPYWNKELAVHWEFEHAIRPDSEAAAIWHKAGRICGESHCRVHGDLGTAHAAIERLKRGTAVSFIASWAAEAVTINLCNLWSGDEAARAWLSSDDAAVERLLILIKSAALDRQISRSFDALFQRVSQAALLPGIFRLKSDVVHLDLPPDPTARASLRECKMTTILYPESRVAALGRRYYSDLTVLVLSAAAVSLLLLAIERRL